MMERRRALDGSLPRRVVRNAPAARAARPTSRSPRCCAGSGTQAASTTMAFTRLLRNLARDEQIGAAHRADHPRRGPHVRHGRAVPRVQDLRRRRARSTSPSTPTCCCPTPRRPTARSSRRASPRPAPLASFIAAGTAYATRGVPMVPFFIFYSMFGFQRVGDLIWAAADARTRGFLLGATAGRTTLLGEGLQHQDGHSLLLASTVPGVPGLRPGVRLRDGDHRQARHPPHVRARQPTRATSSTTSPSTTRTTRCRRCRTGRHRGGDRPRPLPLAGRARRTVEAGHDPVLRARPRAPPAGRGRAGRALRRRRRAVVGHVATRRCARTRSASSAGTACTPASRRARPLVSRAARPTPPGPIVAVTDFMKVVPDQIARFVPDRPFVPLGTDGFGRSRHPRGAAALLRDRRRPRRRRRARRPGRRRARSRPRRSPTPSPATASTPRPPNPAWLAR